MQRSDGRILVTHAGSLPRPKALVELFVRQSRGEAVDAHALAAAVDAATRDSVARQRAAGIDVGNDGEQGRESFFTHVQHRMTGFGGTSSRPVMRDITHFPSFLSLRLADFSKAMVNLMAAPRCVGPVAYRDPAPVREACRAFRGACDAADARFVEGFMTAPSPGIVAAAMTNDFYPRLEDYVAALAGALATEYREIVAQGLVLQIDAPDLAMERHTLFADRPLADFLGFVDVVVDALNGALADVPAERVRLHVCWGNYEGPHLFDVALEEILPRLYRARVGGLVLSLANPRHAHEHRLFAHQPLPDGWVLMAGVVDPTTNYVEHPEVVADRIEAAARAVGDPRRVLAGADCGFEVAAGLGEVAEEVVWEKLRALRAGANLATQRLFA